VNLNPTIKLPLGILGPVVAAALAIGGSLIATKVSAARGEERLANHVALLQETRDNVKTLEGAFEAQMLHLQRLDDSLQHITETVDRMEDYMHMRPPTPRGWERDPVAPPIPTIPQ